MQFYSATTMMVKYQNSSLLFILKKIQIRNKYAILTLKKNVKILKKSK